MSAQGNGSAAPPPGRRVHAALIDLCFERGFAAVTVEDLCRRAEVDRSYFDAEWSGLEDCFCTVYGVERERIMGTLADACEGIEDWRVRVRAAAYATLRVLTEDERVTNFVIAEVRSAGERAQRMVGEAIESLFDLLDEGRLERGAGAAAISRDTAVAVGGGIFNQIWLAVGRGEPITEEAVPRMLHAVILPYLGPEAAMEELQAAPPTLPPPRR